jgi:hypothetical protein
MTLASRILTLSMYFLLTTYLAQGVQIFLLAVPSAGFTFEMLSILSARGGHGHRFCHISNKYAVAHPDGRDIFGSDLW